MAYIITLYTQCGVKVRFVTLNNQRGVAMNEALAVAAAQGFMVRGMVSRAVVSQSI